MSYNYSIQRAEQEITTTLRKANIELPDPDIEAITRQALLESKVFLRAQPPVIAVTGITSTGKSSLINALFGEKKLEEGLTADTTSRVVKIQFFSGLLIYDTPGAGGNEGFENITRAYLGLKQLEKGLDDEDLEPVVEVPTIDAHNYDSVTDEPKQLKKLGEFEKPDLFIFVVNIKAGTLKRDDIRFYREVAKIGPPVMVVVNQIDDVDDLRIQAGLALVQQKLDRRAIGVSAKTGENIQEVAMAIVRNLPLEFANVVRETINKGYLKLLERQAIATYLLTTAVKTAQIVSTQPSIDDARLLVSHVLALYGVIVSKYNLSESRLRSAGIRFSDIVYDVEHKLKAAKAASSGVQVLALAGIAGGIAIATVATHGLALPIVLGAIGTGGTGGGIAGAVAGVFNGIFKRKRILDMEPEARRLKEFISTAHRYDTAASVLAFGRSLQICCDNLEEGKPNIDFAHVFSRESSLTLDELKPFSESLKKDLSSIEQERLIKELAEHFIKNGNPVKKH